MAQLMCEGLCVGYDGKAVLKDLNFEVAAGDYLCIVGANGSGKSTLMKTILGLQPPVSGSVIMGDGLQRKEISYLPQQTAVQTDFPASVREIVLSGDAKAGLFIPEERSSLRWNPWRKCRFPCCRNAAIEHFPVGSSNGCCWHARCAPHGKYCF